MSALQWANNEKVRLAEVWPSNISIYMMSDVLFNSLQVSSLDRGSLYEPFMYLASKLNPPPNKSAFAQISSTIKRERNKSELE